MGMDISGKDPSNKRGEYFRSGFFSWPDIMDVISQANDEYDLGFDIQAWSFNDGEGLDTQEECNQLADAMEKVLNEGGVLEVPENRKVQNSMLAALSNGGMNVVNVGSRDPSDRNIREFISFLRCCGGFAIW